MLEKIIISNLKSFRNKTEISFAKTNYTILPQNVSNSDILKGAIIVGANASGKSNVIFAIKLLLDLLFLDKTINFQFLRCLFSNENKFSISYWFLINSKHIKYTIEIEVNKLIIYENLEIEDQLLLMRAGTTATSWISGENGIVYDEADIDKETLFLRTLYFNTKFTSNPELKTLMEYLQNSVYVNAVERRIVHYGKKKLQIYDYLNENGTEKINSFLTKYNFNQTIKFSQESFGPNSVLVLDDNNPESKYIFVKRDDIKVPIPISLESLGNQNLIKMIPAFFATLSNPGMLIIDEFSSGFHPKLEKMLVKYFMNTSEYSQLFFVSHSTSLISNSVMRPDQVYSVEFNGNNGSSVHRFSDDQPRTAQNIEKMYMSGVFGGLPTIKDNFDEDK